MANTQVSDARPGAPGSVEQEVEDGAGHSCDEVGQKNPTCNLADSSVSWRDLVHNIHRGQRMLWHSFLLGKILCRPLVNRAKLHVIDKAAFKVF